MYLFEEKISVKKNPELSFFTRLAVWLMSVGIFGSSESQAALIDTGKVLKTKSSRIHMDPNEEFHRTLMRVGTTCGDCGAEAMSGMQINC